MTTKTRTVLTDQEVENAYRVLKPVVEHTPLQHSEYLSQKYGCQVYLKREDLQQVRSFKIRGAYYAIHQTPEADRKRGVVCASAGNHAQGVAWTSREMDLPATIFMPTTTPQQKVDQVKFFGGENVTIKLVSDTFDEANEAANQFCEQNQQTFIAPFDNLNTMAGQGSLAVEVFDDAAEKNLDVDFLFAAIGGGGLISGVSTHTKAVSPQTTVVGVEPSGARSMAQAFSVDHPVNLDKVDTFVDGAAVKKVGQLTYNTCQKYVDRLVSVPEGLDSQTILEVYSKLAIVAEPAGALSIAALEVYKDQLPGKTVVCVVSGGNNDINRMQEMEEKSLVYQGLQHYFLVSFAQRAGALREFVNVVLNPDDDITKFEYTKKVNSSEGPVLLGIRLGQAENLGQLLDRLTKFDPNYTNLRDNPQLYRMLV
ncbi:threonine ammonia-lyase IlvA [Companilactobacillus zhongbaensis]|uniref:threonine ammonia-lyase IlvA n=1 Tax=Companilactobacillus zhongbaensis TaxID=2486009 RepID=UPI000F7A4A89|nr:threonine ammonia-lyase IlvA [Companilactobacillus zhongbaensis]